MIVKWLVSALVAPFVTLGGKYLDNQKDKEKLEHGTERAAYAADAAVRRIVLSSLWGRIPLFVLQMSAVTYFATVMIDSIYANDITNPLKLPESSEIVYQTVIASVVGITVWKQVFRK